MAVEIKLQPEEVWPVFQRDKERLKHDMDLIASNMEYGVEIYLTEQDGYPSISVLVDDMECCCDLGINESDCKRTVSDIYDDYLTNRIIETLGARENECVEDFTEAEMEDLIDERENELTDLVFDFIRAVLDTDPEDYVEDADALCADCVDHFLEYLHRKWNLPIYRPMFLEDESGEEFFEEFPYDSMEFEDGDNPIYH